MADVRVKEYNLKDGDVRQIKILDNTAPIRFYAAAGSTFTYDHLIGDEVISSGTAIANGHSVLLAADVSIAGVFGSEIRINCILGTGTKLLVSYMG